MINIGCEYNIKEDINFILETERINSADLSERTKVSRTTLDGIQKGAKLVMMFAKKYIHMPMRTSTGLILLKKN